MSIFSIKYRVMTYFLGDWTESSTDRVVYVPEYKKYVFWNTFYDSEKSGTMYFLTEAEAESFIEERKDLLSRVGKVKHV